MGFSLQEQSKKPRSVIQIRSRFLGLSWMGKNVFILSRTISKVMIPLIMADLDIRKIVLEGEKLSYKYGCLPGINNAFFFR